MFKKVSHVVIFSFFALACASAQAAVILQYHHVSKTLPKVTSVDASTFRAHMQYLKKNDFKVIALDTLIEGLKQGESYNDKTVAITFDDGYDNNIEQAAPILNEFGYPYTIFVNPKLIDEQRSYVMTWEQLKTLSQQGALIANHSAQHDYLHHRLDGESDAQWQERIRADLQYSEKRIEEELGYSLKYLAYPYGEFDRALQQLVQDMGYVGIGQHSGAVGPDNDFTRLPRFPASGFYADLDTLSTKLASLPFHIDTLTYDDTVTTKRQPELTISFKEKGFHQNQFACYVSGQGRAELNWLSAKQVKITAKQELGDGRARYNCTAPSQQASGRYFWFSQPWVITSSPAQ